MATERYDKDVPLRLDTAAKIAFPDGTMTVKGLRKERDRGRLATEIIANKEYTTLAAIEEMRRLCRVQTRASARDPLESVDLAQAACAATLERLKNTKPK